MDTAPEALRRHAEILHLTREAIIVHNEQDGRIIFWNRGATDLYGWTEEEALGRIPHKLLQTRSSPTLDEILATVRDVGRWSGDLVHTTKNGGHMLVSSRWSTRRNLQGDVCDIVEINFDITANKIAEERDREQERLASLGAAAATLVHEIANPLTAISGTIQNLQMQIYQDDIDKAELERWMATLGREIDRLAALLDQIRSLDRPLTLDLQRIDLLNLLQEIWIFEEPACRSRGIDVIHSCGQIPAIVADWNQMKQAILNIIKNAAEAMPEGGRLVVKTYATDGQVHVEIKDTGTGIPQGVDVFAMFKTTKPSGTGLGLPFVKQIIAAHQGSIDYVTEPDAGTTFKISLPINTETRSVESS